jgi:uncharacterized protein
VKTNPFKFGTIVDGQFFTDREDESARISSFIEGVNHLIMISPRRYGKTSLIRKVIRESGRKHLFLDLQMVLTAEDMAAQLLKRLYRIYPVQKLKSYIRSFRIIPLLSMNPVTGQTEISFRTDPGETIPLEDVLNLIENIARKEKARIIVVFDEFQEIFRIGKNLDRFLRSVMQTHKSVNYIFLGSGESMLREIFEKASSPFFRFGSLMVLGKIPREKFREFLEANLRKSTKHYKELAEDILVITASHPYYTQQLAFNVWGKLQLQDYKKDLAENSADEIVQSHDNDYERIWGSLNRTDMIVLTGISTSDLSPLSGEFSGMFGTGAPSTVFSALQRLTARGLIVKEGASYSIDDPFLKRWIVLRRQI